MAFLHEIISMMWESVHFFQSWDTCYCRPGETASETDFAYTFSIFWLCRHRIQFSVKEAQSIDRSLVTSDLHLKMYGALNYFAGHINSLNTLISEECKKLKITITSWIMYTILEWRLSGSLRIAVSIIGLRHPANLKLYNNCKRCVTYKIPCFASHHDRNEHSLLILIGFSGGI